MQYDKLKWIAALAALTAVPAWWMVNSGEREAAAKDPPPPASSKPADSAPDAGTPTPTIAGVFPPSSSSAVGQIILIQGDHFGTAAGSVNVYYGPKGFPRECKVDLADPPTEKLVRCKLSVAPPLGEAQHFVVSVKSGKKETGEKATPSDPSTATYTLLGTMVVTKHEADRTLAGAQPPYVQVHLQGEYFSVDGGDAPSVSWQPNAGAPVQCRNVVLISPSELFCSLPREKYDAARSPGGFTVVRAGEQ